MTSTAQAIVALASGSVTMSAWLSIWFMIRVERHLNRMADKP